MTDNDLRWQLRQLPRELDPPRDLWQGIAARLPQPAGTRRVPRSWLGGLALAASLCLAIGLAWRMAPTPATPDPQVRMVNAEVDAMVREFQFALQQLDGGEVPAVLQTDLAILDQSADSIRAALRDRPESTHLLEQLRRTYSLRLALTQRAVTS